MSLPDFSLTGEAALITGARRGIGKAIALVYAEAGADLAICDKVVEDGLLESTGKQIREMGRKCITIGADVSQKAEIDKMVERTIAQFGKIDILVNNAGIAFRSPVLETSEEDWDRVFNIDLKSYFLCAQAAAKKMVERKKGNIINISTQWAFKTATGGMGTYGIAKAGVVMLTRVLSRELNSYNIRANSIAPGMVKTDFSYNSWRDPENLKRIEASILLGRAAETGDIVGAALFLASPASSYISGQTIIVDGGGLA
jgi:NAD(P)-dependent dehydrogenase (short-subunit alcohol dehydrogenase family)